MLYIEVTLTSTLMKRLMVADSQKQQVDAIFLSQINEWRIALSNELYSKGKRYTNFEVLNDFVQDFIN